LVAEFSDYMEEIEKIRFEMTKIIEVEGVKDENANVN